MSQWSPPIIVGHCTHKGRHVDSPLFAQLGLDTPREKSNEHWILKQDDERLSLIRPDGVSLCVDFVQGKVRHRTTTAAKGAQTLNKALGVNAYHRAHGIFPDIVDATGGLGQDAWAIASLGCRVSVIEQNAIVHALLANGLERARQDDASSQIASRVQLIHANAETALPAFECHAIYLDPMYPDRTRKKAESKKGMQFLQALLGPASPAQTHFLLQQALTCPVCRVAVKRPKGAEVLEPDNVENVQRVCIESPNTRYDVYLPASQSRKF